MDSRKSADSAIRGSPSIATLSLLRTLLGFRRPDEGTRSHRPRRHRVPSGGSSSAAPPEVVRRSRQGGAGLGEGNLTRVERTPVRSTHRGGGTFGPIRHPEEGRTVSRERAVCRRREVVKLHDFHLGPADSFAVSMERDPLLRSTMVFVGSIARRSPSSASCRGASALRCVPQVGSLLQTFSSTIEEPHSLLGI